MGTTTIAKGDTYISDTNGTVTSVSGTTNRITVTSPTTTPVIDIAPTYVGQSSITTLGTIGTGVWQGTVISATYLDTNIALLNAAQTYTKAQRGAIVTLTDAATIAVDASLGNNFQVTLGGSRTLGVPTNMVAGQTGFISVRQDSTGSHTLAYSWPYQFPGGSAPVLSTGKFAFDQLYYSINNYATSTVTMTIATPCVVTWTGHGLISGQILQLTTTGALPTGLSANTTYWVNVVDANTFNLSSSLANLQAGTFIATSGSQSGVHTATSASITISNNLGLA